MVLLLLSAGDISDRDVTISLLLFQPKGLETLLLRVLSQFGFIWHPVASCDTVRDRWHILSLKSSLAN